MNDNLAVNDDRIPLIIKNYKLELEIPVAMVRDLFQSAIEGGDPVTTKRKGGWCEGIYFKNKDFDGPIPEGPEGEPWYSLESVWQDPDLTIDVVEYHEETDKHTPHKITQRAILRGLMHLMVDFPKRFTQILEDEIDAPLADIFLQCVVFGEEKYA